jgi:UDP-glucose 4-epimerase
VLPVTELTPIQPAASVYGNTKQIGEEILRDVAAANKALKMIALRYFNPIGAHPSAQIGELPLGIPSNLVPYLLQTASGLRQQLTVFGDDYPTPDGTCIRDYIHVMDLAEAHVSALQALGQMTGAGSHYDVFNIGAGQGNSVLELIRTFESVSGQALNYRIGPRRAGDVTAVYADATKAREQLGWTAKRSLREALEDSWRWEQMLRAKV